MGVLKVIEPGLLSTIQDKGRWGYQQFGVAVAGAMDIFSLEVANKLVGNPSDFPVIEMTLMGGSFQVSEKCLMAITGADMEGKIDGQKIPLWQSFVLRPGQTLSFSLAKKGVRTYVAINGGFDIEKVLGSYSTYLRGKMGGFFGRKLEKSDEIPLFAKMDYSTPKKLPSQWIPSIEEETDIRVVLGPQEEYFSKESLEIFFGEEYQLSDQVDRMGYRLKGKKIPHKKSADIISDGIVFGSIQIPGDGQPTIMMADHQTTGGYTKIATVISPDLSSLAQLGPNKKIRFIKMDEEQGHNLYKKWRRDLDSIEEHFVDMEQGEDENITMDLGTIDKIMNYFTHSNVSDMVLDIGQFHMELKKSKSKAEKEVLPAKEKSEKKTKDLDTQDMAKISVKAPVDGICYRAPGEGERPFIEVGDRVKKGDTLLIIEVMKMMNEIDAPEDGWIKSIDFQNEERVEAGQIIVTME